MIKTKDFDCPVCGKRKFNENGDYDICKYCGWENDAVMNDDPSIWGGANDLCQIDFKLRYEYYVRQNPKYMWKNDGFPDVQQVESMYCPVCKKFHFEPLTWDEIYCGDKPSDIFCFKCGWHYDLAQAESPNLKNGANAMSLNEYKDWYANKIKENPNYDYWEEIINNYMPTPHRCPVCGKYEFEDESCYDICPFCGWEDDGTEDDANIIGANDLCFCDYKKRYEQYTKQNSDYKWEKDGTP